MTLTNCTLSDNSATLGNTGGGINNNGGTLTLTNCTLSGNSAHRGGGIYNVGDDRSGTMTLRETIVANSPSGGDCVIFPGIVLNDGHNLIEDAANSCGLTNGVNGNVVGVAPLLGPLTDNGGPTQTIALLPGSPAINAGDPEVCANPPVNGLDQRGYMRPGTGHTQCSIGAYEADSPGPPLPCGGDCHGDGRVSIDELITLVNIALGTTQALACPHGVPSGADVDVALIIQAVNVALSSCGDG